jgi:uncharacterized protein (DUF983 family)
MNDAIPTWKVLFSRGVRRKCPQCGQGALFSHWYKLRSHCPVCGLKYLENQGDLWGVLLFADRVLFMVPLIAVVMVTQNSKAIWPYFFGGVLALGLILTFPHRMGISVAFEYHIRRTSSDLSGEQPPRKD